MKKPLPVVLSFLQAINAHDVDAICELMTEDHLFVDGLGNKLTGMEKMRKGWTGYFRLFPDYAVSHRDILCEDEIVLLTGKACGTFAVAGQLSKENHWELPAAWKAVVRGDRIAEWHVYADNQPARKAMGDQTP